jgi:hypothetical protein
MKDANGAGAEQRLTQSSNRQLPSDWSPDGRWILYDEHIGNQLSMAIMPAPPNRGPSAAYLPSNFSQSDGRFSPDGKWVAFESEESGRTEVYIEAFPEPRGKVRVSTKGGMYPEWGAGGRELFYVSPEPTLMSAEIKLGTASVQPANPRALFPVTVPGSVSPYTLAPDGKRILVSEPERTVRPLKVIVNWTALLK